MLISLLALVPGASADELGRLFFTPEQRARLDFDVAHMAQPDANSGNGLILNGIVQKNGGKRTAWINGVSQPAGQSDSRSPDSMTMTLPGQSGPVRVKVGQKVTVSPTVPAE